MLELFTSREIAVGIWTVIFVTLIFTLTFRSTKQTIYSLIRKATNKYIIIFFVTIFAYATIWIKVLSIFSLWDWKYLKDIIFWVFFAGIPLCFNAVTIKNENYFWNAVKSNFKFVVFLEFIISTFTFSFIVEMILVPVASLLVLFSAVASTDDSYKSVKKFFSYLQVVIGFIILLFTAKSAVQHYLELNNIDMLISFTIPIIMTFVFLPLSYMYAIYAEYENLLLGMNFKLPKEKTIRRRAKWNLFRSCRFSWKKVHTFKKNHLAEIYRRMSEKDLDDVFERFRLSIKRSK